MSVHNGFVPTDLRKSRFLKMRGRWHLHLKELQPVLPMPVGSFLVKRGWSYVLTWLLFGLLLSILRWCGAQRPEKMAEFLLQKIHTLGYLNVTGEMSTCPNAAMEVILDLPLPGIEGCGIITGILMEHCRLWYHLKILGKLHIVICRLCS